MVSTMQKWCLQTVPMHGKHDLSNKQPYSIKIKRITANAIKFTNNARDKIRPSFVFSVTANLLSWTIKNTFNKYYLKTLLITNNVIDLEMSWLCVLWYMLKGKKLLWMCLIFRVCPQLCKYQKHITFVNIMQ